MITPPIRTKKPNKANALPEYNTPPIEWKDLGDILTARVIFNGKLLYQANIEKSNTSLPHFYTVYIGSTAYEDYLATTYYRHDSFYELSLAKQCVEANWVRRYRQKTIQKIVGTLTKI